MSRFARPNGSNALATAVGLAALAFVAIAPAPAMAATGESSEYYEDALSRFDRGEYPAAIIDLKNALKENPKDPAARLLLGRAYLRISDGASAEKEIKRARRIGADEDLVLVPLARAYLMQGKYTNIFEEIRPGHRDVDIDAEVMAVHGQAYLELRKLDEAEKAFDEAAKLRPDATLPILGRARVMLARGQFDAAEELVGHSTKLDEGDAELWYVKGEIKRLKRDLGAAVANYAKAIEIEPRHLAARIGRAASLIDLDRDAEAIPDIEYVRGLDPRDSQAAYLQALILARTGDVKGAQEVLTDASMVIESHEPGFIMNHAPTLLLSGVINYAQKDFDAAYTYLQRYLELNPRHPGARKLIGAIMIRRGDPEGALAMLRSAMPYTPDDPELFALLGSAHMRLKQYAQATTMLEKAAELAPNKTAIRTQLALSRLATGDRQQGMEDLGSVLAEDSSASQTGLLLGLVHLKNRDYPETLRVARILIERDPGNPFAHNLAGAGQLGLGDLAASRASFERALEVDPTYLPAESNLAKIDIVEGNIEGAKKRYLSILERKPTETRAMIDLSKIAEAENRLKDAIAWLQKAVSHRPDAIDLQLRLVGLYLRVEQTEAAANLARDLEARDPRNPAVLEARGRAELAAGRETNAQASFRRIAEIVGDSAEGLRRIAILQFEARDIEGARGSLQKAIALDPDAIAPQAALIRLEARVGNVDKALDFATRLRRAHSASPVGDLLTGDLLMHARRFDEAAEAYAAGLEKETSSALVTRLYRAQRNAGKADTALPMIEEWVSGHPGDIGARRLLATALAGVGRLEDAIAQNERLLEEAPDDAAILNNLAWLYQRTGDPRAVPYARKAHDLAPDEPATLDTLGWILVLRGEVKEGLKLLRQAATRASKNPQVRYHIAEALSRLGRPDEARRELERLLRSSKDFESLAEARALLRRLAGD